MENLQLNSLKYKKCNTLIFSEIKNQNNNFLV